MYINRTIKSVKRQNDNLRQLVLIRQDHVLVNESTCFFTSDSGIFFFFETFYGDGLTRRTAPSRAVQLFI